LAFEMPGKKITIKGVDDPFHEPRPDLPRV